MKLHVIRKIAIASMVGAVVCGFVSCKEEDNQNPPVVVTELELVNPAQSALSFEATKSQQIITIKTDAPSSVVSVSQVAGEAKADWCIVKIKSATEITVDVALNDKTVSRKATYTIKAGDFAPIKFTVTQDFPEPASTVLSIDMEEVEWVGYIYNAAAVSPADFEVTVSTTSNTWSAVADFFGEPYFEVVTGTGRNGDKAVVRFIGTNAGANMGGSLVISSGNADDITVTINQDAPAANTIKIASTDDWQFANPYATNHAVTFAAADKGSAKKQVFGVEANGSFETKVCNTGTTTETTETWLNAFGGAAGINIYTASENAGAARSLDVVLFGGTTELFRFKVTQEAGIQ